MPLYAIDNDHVCPECGGDMELRQPKQGDKWKPFYGCMQYPKCRGTLSLNGTTTYKKEVKPLSLLPMGDEPSDVESAPVERFIRYNGVARKYTPPDTTGWSDTQLAHAYAEIKGWV